MKISSSVTSLLLSALLACSTSAQLLAQGNGDLPQCGQSCSVLTQAQSTCNGGSNVQLSTWACFCKTVYANSNGALTTMCQTSCSSPSDNTAIGTWFTANCGSDNGASEHESSGSGSGNSGGSGSSGGSDGSSPSGVAGAGGPSTTANAGTYATGENDQVCSDWWSCHWKWVVMIIVLAVGLTVLGFGGRWLKKRHDRKQDRITSSFNAGITTRQPPMSNSQLRDSSVLGAGTGEAEQGGGSGRNSPVRTRDAFMPYGYGYTRSESRLASHGNNDRGSPLARGSTPVNELEKAQADAPEAASRKKSRRVLVRERSGDDENEKTAR